MLLGLRSAIYLVPDLAKARKWYAEVLGKAPYYDRPEYVGFDAGGFELGLFPAKKLHTRKAAMNRRITNPASMITLANPPA